MPILNRIQQRSFSGGLLLAAIYAILSIGAVTMLYPFLLMLSGSMKSELDMHELDVIPRFLYDEQALFQRFEEQRYAKLDAFNSATLYRDEAGRRLYAFDQLPVPIDGQLALVKLWEKFLQAQEDAPVWEMAMGHFASNRTVAELQLRYQKQVLQRFPETRRKDIVGLAPAENWLSRNYQPIPGRAGEVYRDLRAGIPARFFYPVSVRGYFLTLVLPQSFPPNAEGLQKLNEQWGTDYRTFADIPLPDRAPTHPAMRKEWWQFVQNSLSARFLELEPPLVGGYRSFLERKYGDILSYNRLRGTSFSGWKEVLPPDRNRSALEISDLEEFVRTLPGPDGLRLRALEFRWPEYLREQFSDNLVALNESLSSRYTAFSDVPMPILEYDYHLLRTHRAEIIWEFVTRNYRVAWNEVVIQGNGLRNTVIFCLLNILTALIINPLAAYALSRFQPGWGQKALFVMMATMAFPAEVTQIPSFLLLRDLGWLNTFAALVIPAAANGYSIFLLKGFFDSLPQELYEAANIDGCGEIRAFFQITVPLSTPILAVVALAAFTASYGAFMFALLVCQNESMWTLMVYIYQLQQTYAQPIVFAALIIAAFPTLLVFLTCQNVIMRGIVVPVEK